MTTATKTKKSSTTSELIALGKAVIRVETEAIHSLLERIDQNFAKACSLIMGCVGRVVVTGMGKSGHIASKIAATLASTGTPAFFVHPGEASHGDMGMITSHDVVLALSNSGKTEEIIRLLPCIKRLSAPLITMTGIDTSALAQAATVNLDVSVHQEACPLGLAPTSSTTASLAMGDALAIALLQAKGFTADDFALSHPGGALGRRLLLRVTDIMHTGEQIPSVTQESLLSDALIVMTEKKLGMTAVLNSDGQLKGIFTDGDLRRALNKGVNVHQVKVETVMTHNCKTITSKTLAIEALNIMEKHKINALLVMDGDNNLIGAINMHDLLAAGVL